MHTLTSLQEIILVFSNAMLRKNVFLKPYKRKSGCAALRLSLPSPACLSNWNSGWLFCSFFSGTELLVPALPCPMKSLLLSNSLPAFPIARINSSCFCCCSYRTAQHENKLGARTQDSYHGCQHEFINATLVAFNLHCSNMRSKSDPKLVTNLSSQMLNLGYMQWRQQ